MVEYTALERGELGRTAAECTAEGHTAGKQMAGKRMTVSPVVLSRSFFSCSLPAVPAPVSRRALLSAAAAVAAGSTAGLAGQIFAQQTGEIPDAQAAHVQDGKTETETETETESARHRDEAGSSTGKASGAEGMRLLRLGYIADTASPAEEGVSFLAERLNGQHGMLLERRPLRGRGWGDTQNVLYALKSGSLDMGLVETEQLAHLHAGMAVWGMPYLFDSAAQAHQMLDGEVGQSVLNGLVSQGLKGLAYWEGGFLVTGSSVRSVVRPEDAAGLRVAVPAGCATLRAMCGALKARAVLMQPRMDYAAAIQQGTVDAQMSPVDWMVRRRLYTEQRFVSMMHQQYAALALVVRLPVWQALDESQRAQLSLLAAFARDYQRQRAHRSRAMALLELSQAGCTVSTFDRMQVRRFARRFEKVSAEVVRRCGSRLWLELFEAREKLTGYG